MLVTSELVTNAVQHSGCTEEDFLEVIVAADDTVRISVTDPGNSGGSARVTQRDAGFGGLGLQVVEQLATTWGSERRPEGYVVWAELAVTERQAETPYGRPAGREWTPRSEPALSGGCRTRAGPARPA